MPAQNWVVRFGSFEADICAGELRRNGVRLKLQSQPFRVLALLLQRPGQILTREELQQELWPSGTFVDYEQGLATAVNKCVMRWASPRPTRGSLKRCRGKVTGSSLLLLQCSANLQDSPYRSVRREGASGSTLSLQLRRWRASRWSAGFCTSRTHATSNRSQCCPSIISRATRRRNTSPME